MNNKEKFKNNKRKRYNKYVITFPNEEDDDDDVNFKAKNVLKKKTWKLVLNNGKNKTEKEKSYFQN